MAVSQYISLARFPDALDPSCVILFCCTSIFYRRILLSRFSILPTSTSFGDRNLKVYLQSKKLWSKWANRPVVLSTFIAVPITPIAGRPPPPLLLETLYLAGIETLRN